tara:strand:+ start:574 stop:1809 length:1236 start_codon:yes stop_codon:yes gene_type:complete
MTVPTYQVLVGFQTTTGFGTPFQLDDAFYGVLNTAGRGTLGGQRYADLTSLVLSVNIRRGRNRQLDQFNAGTAQVVFNNNSRVLDPLNTSSIYYPYVLPRAPIIIYANGTPIYTGFVEDWNLDYQNANQGRMVARCVDAFGTLANQQLNAFTPSAETSGVRVNTVLDRPEINYQGSRSIGTGTSTLGAYAVPQDTNALNYLQQINTSEQGYLFTAADGNLTFKGRSSVLNPVSGASFTTNGTGIPYMTLVNQYGSELLYNYIVGQSPAGSAQTSSDANSIALYQTQNYNLLNLLNSTTTEVAGLTSYLLGKYKDPVVRFTGVSCELAALTSAQWLIIFAIDLTSIVTVQKDYSTGTPTSESQTLIVSGIEHRIVPGSHNVSFTMESTDGNQYLTLNDAIFGTLSTTNLLSF